MAAKAPNDCKILIRTYACDNQEVVSVTTNLMAACQSVPIAVDREQINRYLKGLLTTDSEAAGRSVSEAMTYGVLGSGQRIRPILALRISRLLGAPPDLTAAAACAVELLHCASLIIDDLPCMDDSELRRERPAVHIRFGESTAILAAFGLVAMAARTILENSAGSDNRERAVAFQLSLLRTLDCCGLIAGQAMDLESAAANGHRGDSRISDMKTVPLFSLAVQAGSLISVHDANSRAVLSGFGREFGLAFQMSDDLLDGEEEDAAPFYEKLNLLRALVAHFGAAGRDLESLIDYLNDRVSSPDSCPQTRQ